MIRRIDARGQDPAGIELPRAATGAAAITDVVTELLADVRARGDAAVLDATERFDHVRPAALRVPDEALADAAAALDPALTAALVEMIERVRAVHRAQLPADVVVEVSPGLRVTERHTPVGAAGLYVPAGVAPLPSSVVMNAVPAQVAGVARIAVATPPRLAGALPDPAILAACHLVGGLEVYAAGGAQAIAMLAYGTESCPPVDVITGPGNAFVAAAKALVSGEVGIDTIAGPTEIAILADESADPDFLAADLVAQAEHDPLASCLLVTDSASLADRVERELAARLAAAPNEARARAAIDGQSAIVLVDDMAVGAAICDRWAPEHLEVVTAQADRDAARICNAGAIFIGPYAPVSLGDYLAGSNHVLPTAGTARFAGGLSVGSFVKQIHEVRATREALECAEPHIRALGTAEQLFAHVAAVRTRTM